MAGVQIGSMANFPQGFANGLSVRGMPLVQMQPGQVFFVGNGPVLCNPQQKAASNGNRGTFLDPLSTINYAVNTACQAGRGDIVFVLPGHREAISNATTLTFNNSHVAVVGLGAGSFMPTLTFDTATTANVPVRAAGCSIQNVRHLNNFADIASNYTGIGASTTASIATSGLPAGMSGGYMDVTVLGSGTVYVGASVMGTGVADGTTIISQVSGTTGGVGTYQVSISQTVASGTLTMGNKDFAIENCEFRDLSAVLNSLTVFTSSATANGADGFRFVGNRVDSAGTTAATTAIVIGAATDRMVITDNFTVHAILNDTAALLDGGANNMTNLQLARNVGFRPNTSSTGGSFVGSSSTACTGVAHDNRFWQLDASAGIWIATGTKLGFFENYSPITGAADKSGLINPVAV